MTTQHTDQPAVLASTTLMANTTNLTTTIAAAIDTTTTATTTTTTFEDLPGTLLNLHEACIADWDKVYEGNELTPREYSEWNGLHIGRVTLCAWIILSHIAIILFVLGKDMLRVNPKNSLIANLALANLLLAVFVIPVKQHFILNPEVVNCDLELGWTFIADYYQTSVSLFAVFSLVLERFVYVYTQKNQKKVLLAALVIGSVLLLLMPWILSLVILLPTYLTAFQYESVLPGTCEFKVDEDYFVAAQILSFVLPLIGVFILTPYTGLLDCLRPSRCIYEYVTPKGESMAVTSLISLVYICAEAPYCVVRVLMMTMECNNPYCTRLHQALNVAMWVRIGKAAISPFIWLLFTDIRKAVLCHCPTGRDDDNDSDVSQENAYVGVPLVETSRDDDEEVCAKELYPPAIPSTSAATYANSPSAEPAM